jgi:acyl-coenzyme A synthetase/AMP-(fatty) acid ligase
MGELVSLPSIEARLAEEPFLADVSFCVIAQEEARNGWSLILCYENSSDYPQMDERLENARNAWNLKALGYEKIQKILKVSRFPRTDLGKIQKTKILLDS